MADRINYNEAGFPIKYTDNGDGSYAEVVSATATLDSAGLASDEKQDIAIGQYLSDKTVFDESVSLSVVDNISVSFQYDQVSTDFITTAGTSGTGVVSATNGQLVCNTGASGGNAVALSQAFLRYKTGHELRAKFTAEFENISLASGEFMFAGLMQLTTDNTAISNGVGIGYYNDGTGTSFGQWLYKRGTLTFVKQADFAAALNTDGLGNTGRVWRNTEAIKGAIFRLRGGYLGKAPLICDISRGFDLSGKPLFAPFSYIDYSATKGNHLGNASLRLGVFCKGGNDNIVRVGSLNGQVVGNSVDINRVHRIIPSTTRSTITTEAPILAIRNNTTLNSLPNSVEAIAHLIRVKQTAGNAGGTMRYYLIDNADTDLTVSGAWTAFSTFSPCEYHVNAANTFVTTNKERAWAALQTITNVVSQEDFLEGHEGGNSLLKIKPGKTLVVTFAATNAATIEFSGSIIDLF
jgi:hypothetical protein